MVVQKRWYPVSRTGRLVAALYGLVPPYLVCAQSLGAFPESLRIPVVGGLSLVVVCLGVAKYKGKKPFERKRSADSGFTLVELLTVTAIIGLLAALMFPAFAESRQKAYYSRSLAEFRSMYTAIQLYSLENQNQYPPDANRNLPPGLEAYLGPGNWPVAPFPGSVYDWDAWAPASLSYPPYSQVYQISIRFCTAPASCTVPNEPWAAGFDYYSALYYCVQGPCRSHSTKPAAYPGYCVNC